MAQVINQVKPDSPSIRLTSDVKTELVGDITKLPLSSVITSLFYRLNQHQEAVRSAQLQPSSQLFIDQAKDAEKKVKELNAELDRRFPVV
jgi:hypothetical protein